MSIAEGDRVEKTVETSGLIIPSPLLNVLRPHQIAALHFLWRRLIDEGLKRVSHMSWTAPLVDYPQSCLETFGCIISHSMGLDRTVTVLTFLLLLQQHYCAAASTSVPTIRVILLAPRSCAYQWQCNIAEWMVPGLFGDTRLTVYAPHGSRSAYGIILDFYRTGGILFLGYKQYQKLLRHARKRGAELQQYKRVNSVFDFVRSPRQLRSHVSLLEILEGADMVILDESHRLKRLKSNLLDALLQHLRDVQLRVALTGMPLQNHLEEYNIMNSVVTGRMMEQASFRRLFAISIEREQCVGSTFQEFMEMRKRIASLRRLLGATVHYRGPEILQREVPARREYVILVGLSSWQEEAYHSMLKSYKDGDNFSILLKLLHEASHICFHPTLNKKRACTLKHDSIHQDVATSLVKDGIDNEHSNNMEMDTISSYSSQDVMSTSDLNDVDVGKLDVAISPKLFLTLSLLQHIGEDLQEKVVLFSTHGCHLFLLQRIMKQRGINADVLHGELGVEKRQGVIKRFRNDAFCRVLLCATRAGNFDINLVVANHCILFDVSWSPVDDVQATYCVYRHGQKRPVTIYRIATEGTFEHVAYYYALRESGFQKNIWGMMGSKRWESHLKENSLIYPCNLPVDFGLNDDVHETRIHLSKNDVEPQNWQEYAAHHCPALALTATDGTFRWVRSITEHSFLLRDNTEEVIRELGRRFEEWWQVSKASIIFESSKDKDCSPHSTPDFFLERCEPALCAYFSKCAEHLVFTAQRQLDVAEKDSFVEGSAVTEGILCKIFEAVIHLDKPTKGLFEIVATLYHCGVDNVLRNTLNMPSYAKLRAFLDGRRKGNCATGESLLDLLRHKPCAFFASLTPEETMYTLTEMGLLRSFVPHCIFHGMCLKLRKSRASEKTIQTLYCLFAPLDWGGVANDNDKVQETMMLKAKTESVLALCIESLWPPYKGIALSDATVDVEVKQHLMERVYRSARGRNNRLFSVKEAANLVGLCAVRGRRNLYRCKRCADGLLTGEPQDTALRCSRCYYSAEFDLQTQSETRHVCTLYQLSVLCALLESFSVSRSFTKAFTPSACRDVLQVLQQLRHSHAVCALDNFISDLVSIGIDALVSGLPETTLALLRLQCGETKSEALRSRLAVDSSHVWSTVLRSHVRQMVVDWLQTAMAGWGAQTTAMPEVFLVLGLQSLENDIHNGGAYAKELLLTSIESKEVLMMRFICDGLVKLFYAERLLVTSLTRESLDVLMGRHDTLDHNCSDSNSSDVVGDYYREGDDVRRRKREKEGNGTGCSALPSSSFSIASVTRRACMRKRRRHSSLSVCSSAYGGSSVSSSFSSCYVDDDDDGNSVSSGSSTSVSAHRHLTESEEILRQRSLKYWAAYCDVYGTRSIESTTVMVEDEENGMTILPPPPKSFWTNEMKGVTREGLRLSEVTEKFFTKLMALVAAVRVIK